MKTIKSKPKAKPVRRELFFCKECGGPAKGTIYDIAINKRFCSIHQTEEVIDLSGEHSSWFPIFLLAMMHPELVWHGNNIAYICPQCGELHPSSVDCECEVGNEICKRCGSHVKTVNKEDYMVEPKPFAPANSNPVDGFKNCCNSFCQSSEEAPVHQSGFNSDL